MVRDAQDPKRRWLSTVTERNRALSHVVQPIRFKFLIIVFSQQRKVLRLWCQELPVKTFWKVVTLRGMVSTGLTQQPQGTPLECIVTWLLMEVSSNPSLPFKPVENRELVLHETGQRHIKNVKCHCTLQLVVPRHNTVCLTRYIGHRLDIHVMVNWQLSEKSIYWPETHDCIACSDVKFRVYLRKPHRTIIFRHNFKFMLFLYSEVLFH